jgi:hypothetical protein
VLHCFNFTGIFDQSRIKVPDPRVLPGDCPTIEVLTGCGSHEDCIKPVKVVAAGGCSSLFKSLSVALVGDESLDDELRLRACTTFIIHGNNLWQEGKQKGYHHTACASIWEEITEMTTSLKAVSSYAVNASAKALDIGIQVFYPPMNGALDKNIHIHSGFYGDKGAAQQVRIMWTSTDGAKKNPTSNTWVPLIRRIVAPPALAEKIYQEHETEALVATNAEISKKGNVTAVSALQLIANTIEDLKHPKPAKVSADGSCLFNSLSVALDGNESLASQRRRLRACTALITHGNNIWQEDEYNHTECDTIWQEIIVLNSDVYQYKACDPGAGVNPTQGTATTAVTTTSINKCHPANAMDKATKPQNLVYGNLSGNNFFFNDTLTIR